MMPGGRQAGGSRRKAIKGMKEKIRKLKDEAAKLMRKGKYTRALKNLQQVKELNPDDLSVYNNIGYLLRKLDRPGQAIAVFSELAERYAEKGFLLKAVAAYKVILEIQPAHRSTQQKLAKLSPKLQPAPLKVRQPDMEEHSEADRELERLAVEEGRLGVPAQQQDQPREPAQEGTESFAIVVSPPQELLEQMAEDGTELEIPIDIEQMTTEPQPGAEATEASQSLPNIPFLGDLEAEAFADLIEQMKLIRARPGDWIIREGAQGDSMFVITSGQVQVLKRIDDRRMWQVALLGEGSFFGEMAVLCGGKRSASVRANRPTELLEITREMLDELIHRYPAVEETLDRFMTQRLLRNVMNTSPIFKPFDASQRVQIIERFALRPVTAGEVLIQQDRESDGLFVVLRGEFKVFRVMDDDSEVEVGLLREGDVFGEISCLRKHPATASVRAAGPGVVLRLPREDFDELVMSHPQILELVQSLGEQHLSHTLNALAARGILL